ncbi:hypothetical protein JCM16161A_00570 [Vulcanisaeta sp. JCM 16161]
MSIITYIVMAQEITLLPSGLGILTIIAVLIIVPYYVYTRIDKLIKNVSAYGDWDEKCSWVFPAFSRFYRHWILMILSIKLIGLGLVMP